MSAGAGPGDPVRPRSVAVHLVGVACPARLHGATARDWFAVSCWYCRRSPQYREARAQSIKDWAQSTETLDG